MFKVKIKTNSEDNLHFFAYYHIFFTFLTRYNFYELLPIKQRVLVYLLLSLILFGNTVFFHILSISPIVPMVTHYLLVTIFMYNGYKVINTKTKVKSQTLLIAIMILVIWHLPWFFDLATKEILLWNLDVLTISLSAYVLGSYLKGLDFNIELLLFALWMLGESLLSYLWIVNPYIYSKPYSIYNSSQFPPAGTLMFFLMNIVGAYVAIKVLTTRVFNKN